jgi:hypothetical protein
VSGRDRASSSVRLLDSGVPIVKLRVGAPQKGLRVSLAMHSVDPVATDRPNKTCCSA